MNNQYLIPANSKKSRLILGFFTIPDLIVLGVGITITMAFLLVLKNPPLWQLILAIVPLLTAATLVFPVPNYHNVMQLLSNIFYFVLGRKKYYWKGWCVKDDANE